MRTRISTWRMIWMISLGILSAAILLSLLFFRSLFLVAWEPFQFIIVIAFGVFSILFAIITPLQNYYTINDKFIVVRKYSKEIIYEYRDIIYINEELSEKKKTIAFYTNKGDVRYMMFDKNGKNYKTMLAKSKNRINKEEFQKRYPNVKF